MKPTHIRIQELQKEIQNLAVMKEEAKSEYFEADELHLQYLNKRDAAYARMNNLQDEIEYRRSEITDLEEKLQPRRATA
ncbi:hypothetical protein [Brevibacillus panacihumi]|uniref:hypothetical protein n=1 Tax=Brevibacillus panacihumi TaxID=497735 RepID=UPI003D25E356